MTRTWIRLINAFFPNSWPIRLMGLVIIFIGLGLGPLVNSMSADDLYWLAHYLAAAVTAGFGFSLGHVLGQMRIWPSSLLVPGLLNTGIVTAVTLTLLLASVYITILTWTDGLGGYTPSLSYATGCLGVMVGAGLYPRVFAVLLVVMFSLVVSEETRGALLHALELPVTGIFMLMVPVAVVFALLRAYRKPVDPAADDAPVLAFQANRMRMPKYAYQAALDDRSLRAPMTAAFHHSREQAWFNVLSGLGIVVFVTGVTLLLMRGDLVAFVQGSALLVVITVAILPLFQRRLFGAMQDFLWLSGSCRDKRTLAHRSFMQMMRPAFRLCSVALVLYLLFTLVTPHRTDVMAVASMLILAPASAAIMLTLVLTLRNSFGQINSGQLLFFGIAAVLVPGLMNFIALVAGVSLVGFELVTLSLLTTTGIVFAAATLTSRILERQSHWMK